MTLNTAEKTAIYLLYIIVFLTALLGAYRDAKLITFFNTYEIINEE